MEKIRFWGRRRPAFQIVDGLRVPALTQTPQWHAFDREPAACGIKPQVAAHLEGERDGAARVASSDHAQIQLARLSVAVHRDIGQNRYDDIAEHYGYIAGVEPLSAARTLRDDIAKGRRLWAAIGAWPWQPLGFSEGKFPPEWWRLPAVERALAAWLQLDA